MRVTMRQHRLRQTTSASAQLLIALTDRGQCIGDLDAFLGVSKRYVDMLISGQQIPSVVMAVKLWREYGVSPMAWRKRG